MLGPKPKKGPALPSNAYRYDSGDEDVAEQEYLVLEDEAERTRELLDMLSVKGGLHSTNFSANAYFKFREEREEEWKQLKMDSNEMDFWHRPEHMAEMARELNALPAEERLATLLLPSGKAHGDGGDGDVSVASLRDQLSGLFDFPVGFSLASQNISPFVESRRGIANPALMNISIKRPPSGPSGATTSRKPPVPLSRPNPTTKEDSNVIDELLSIGSGSDISKDSGASARHKSMPLPGSSQGARSSNGAPRNAGKTSQTGPSSKTEIKSPVSPNQQMVPGKAKTSPAPTMAKSASRDSAKTKDDDDLEGWLDDVLNA